MAPEPGLRPRPGEDRLPAQVARHAARKLAGRRAGRRELWSGLGLLGVVGWSIAVPVVGGVLLGGWLDRARPGGAPWTLVGLGLGLALGFANAWRWVAHELGRPFGDVGEAEAEEGGADGDR